MITTKPATLEEINQRQTSIQQQLEQASQRRAELDSQLAAAFRPDVLGEAQQNDAKIESCQRALEVLTQQRGQAEEAERLSRLENHLKEIQHLQQLSQQANQKVLEAERQIEPLRQSLKDANQQLQNRSWDTQAFIQELQRQGISAAQIAAIQTRYQNG